MTEHPEELGPLEIFLGAVNIQKSSNNASSGNVSVHNNLSSTTSGEAHVMCVLILQRSDEVLAAIDHLLSAPPDVLEQSQQEFNSSTLPLHSTPLHSTPLR